jgi:integrase
MPKNRKLTSIKTSNPPKVSCAPSQRPHNAPLWPSAQNPRARAGVRYRNPYQVRHTFASTLLTSGHNTWYVAQQLGHVDVQMVFRIYGKFIAQDDQKPQVQRRVVGQD